MRNSVQRCHTGGYHALCFVVFTRAVRAMQVWYQTEECGLNYLAVWRVLITDIECLPSSSALSTPGSMYRVRTPLLIQHCCLPPLVVLLRALSLHIMGARRGKGISPVISSPHIGVDTTYGRSRHAHGHIHYG